MNWGDVDAAVSNCGLPKPKIESTSRCRLLAVQLMTREMTREMNRGTRGRDTGWKKLDERRRDQPHKLI